MQIVEKINWIDDYEFSGTTGPCTGGTSRSNSPSLTFFAMSFTSLWSRSPQVFTAIHRVVLL
jgi:hypothetical protein